MLKTEFLQTIHRNSLRIGKLVGDLLELESLEAGGSRSLEVSPVAIAPIVSRVAETLQLRAESRSSDIEIEIDTKLVAMGDDEAIERIALNLVHNALNHGGERITVRVVGEQQGEQIVVRFIDNGTGIDPAHHERIFDRLFRGQASRSGEGSGLGLAIARQLAHRMNGTLELAKSAKSGTELVLKLPAPPS